MTWILQAITEEIHGNIVEIDRDVLVGRHQSADIVLQSAEISRKHATFLVKEDALWLQDLGSSNGTFVNGQRIQTETQLKQGDQIQFASLKFQIDYLPEETEAVVEKTPAQSMNEQGMPELSERDADVQLSKEGMPQNISIPKPAPIPEGTDLTSVTPEPKPIPVEQPISRVEEESEKRKNFTVGILVILAIVVILACIGLFQVVFS